MFRCLDILRERRCPHFLQVRRPSADPGVLRLERASLLAPSSAKPPEESLPSRRLFLYVVGSVYPKRRAGAVR